MSGAQDVVYALSDVAAESRSALAAAVGVYKAETFVQPDDVIDAMQHAARMILAAEGIEDAAKQIGRDYRAALAAAMLETGCPQVRLDTHTVSITEPRPKLSVLDPKALPFDLLKQPAPVPDMERIRAAYDAGIPITGVAMLNGGPPFVSFKSRSKS